MCCKLTGLFIYLYICSVLLSFNFDVFYRTVLSCVLYCIVLHYTSRRLRARGLLNPVVFNGRDRVTILDCSWGNAFTQNDILRGALLEGWSYARRSRY